MKKIKKVLIVVVAVVVFIGLSGLFSVTQGLDEGKQVLINEVDLSELDDGVYRGDYNHGRWANQVETIHERVLKDQSLLVDVVSGATVSSKAYLKAIENALQGNPAQ